MTNIQPSKAISPERSMRKHKEAFNSVVWPALAQEGWTKIDATETTLNGRTIIFVPPVKMLKVGKKGEDFYDDEEAVIERLLERRTEAEARIGSSYLDSIGSARGGEQRLDKSTGGARPKKNNAKSPDGGATSKQEEGEATPIKRSESQGETQSDCTKPKPIEIEIDSSPPAKKESPEINTLSEEQDQQSEENEAAMDLGDANDLPVTAEAQCDETEKSEASATKGSQENDTTRDVEGDQEETKEAQKEDQVMTEPATSRMKDEAKQEEDQTRTEPIRTKDDSKQDEDHSMTEPTSTKDEAGQGASEAMVEEETAQIGVSPRKEETDVGKDSAAEGEVDSGGVANEEQNELKKAADAQAGPKKNGDQGSADGGADKEIPQESASKSAGGARRPRAASKKKEKDMYKEDKLDDMIEEEDEGTKDESEQQSTEGDSKDGSKGEGIYYESPDDDGKRKRRKRKATKDASGEGKSKGRGRSKRKARAPPSPKRAKTPPPPPRGRKPTRQPSVAMIDLSWKNGGKTFPKKVSQVGPEFNATEIPEKGSWKENESSIYCEQIWDPELAEEKLQAETMDFLAKKNVPHNKREAAMVGLAEVGYDAEKFDEQAIVDQIITKDGTEWSEEERKQYHLEIFRVRKDIREVSKCTGKSMNSCLAYYLGTYKTSDDYRLMKTVHYQERLRRMLDADHDLDSCAVCGDGGNLLICDGCEGEYHMECMRPALESIPEGKWECDECVDRAFLAAKDALIRNSNLFQRVNAGGNKNGSDNEEPSSSKDKAADGTVSMRLKPTAPVLDIVSRLAHSLGAAFSDEAVNGV